MDEELKTLIDLTYAKFRDEFERQVMEEEKAIIRNFAARGIRGGPFYKSIIDLHLNKIRQLYKKRLELEKELLFKKYGCIPNSEVQGLKDRLKSMIEAGIRNLENKTYPGGKTEAWMIRGIKEKGLSLQLESERDINIEIGFDKLEMTKHKVAENRVEEQQEIYIDETRIRELVGISNKDWDLSKLIQILKEMNICYSKNCYLSIIMLTRSLIDHVPPIFSCKIFSEVANNYKGTKSFKASMQHLDESSRNIADQHLHCQIRKSETLPNKTQINFSNDIDVLLSEIVRILKQ